MSVNKGGFMMSVYMIRCQNQQGKPHDKVYQTVGQFGDCYPSIGSSWLVSTTMPVQQIRAQIEPLVNQDEHCAIIDVMDYAGWLPHSQWSWIRQQQEK